MEEWEKQLAVLRGLTETTGAIHEAQLFQIKHWGAVAFSYAGKSGWTATVSEQTKTVLFTVTTKRARPKSLAKWVAGLDRSIHWLFGAKWALHIDENGKPLYRGERVKAAPKKTDDKRKPRRKNPKSNSSSK